MRRDQANRIVVGHGLLLTTDPNLSIREAGDKRALVPKGAAKGLAAALLPSYKHREPLFFAEISEDSHAAKPPCAG
jgi:hypothetical protein